MEAYPGTTVSGFPNFFMVPWPNTGLGQSSMILMIEAQINLMMETVKVLKQKNAKFIDLKMSVQQSYNRQMQEEVNHTVWKNGGCHSWYQTSKKKRNPLAGFTFTFMKRTKKFEEEKYEIAN